ncbi:MAG: hypothetical protein FJZ00_00160 [Candidatus Sericytochromatia bacterium]|uniref:Uncharacterized protein n=1 Tax=Candidatus Tanganyikabacteria bacterium TaxID=2961651 RepID=A0A937X070_9BACT|nr:hypothetical protein [Candidatus Tanganyikabacteria bacterium]
MSGKLTGVVPVNLLTVLTWTVAIVLGFAVIFLLSGMLSGGGGAGGELQNLVPPEIWADLSPAAKASFRVVAQRDEATRERFKRILMRLAEGYLQENRSATARQAYVAILLETLGKLTL